MERMEVMMITRSLFILLGILGLLAQPTWIYYANAPMLASLTFGDLDSDGQDEIIAATYGRGGNPYQRGIIFVFEINGDSLPGWPVEVTTGPIPSTPAIGDIDGDGKNELVVGNWSQAFVFKADGTNYPGWPKPYGAYFSPTLEDIDRDGDMEIIYPSGSRIYVFQHDGSILPGFPVSVPHDYAGTPAVADIDGDSLFEIVAGINRGPVTPGQFELYAWNDDGSLISGFPVFLCGIIKSPPALGDLDGDGTVEIVVNAYHSSNYDTLYVLDSSGNIKPGWPVSIPYCRLSGPALADIDKDGDLEILTISGYGYAPQIPSKVHAYHHDGTTVQNWPVTIGGIPTGNSSPIVSEIDGDTLLLEILVKAQDKIFAYHSDGSPVSGFPYALDDSNHSGTTSPSPVVGDLDHDQDVEYCFSSCYGEIHFFDESSFFDDKFEEWSMFKHDERNTSFYPCAGGPGVAENQKDRFYINIWPNPFINQVDIRIKMVKKWLK
ncbi:MAG TPA: VCBS repeat-containing protein, partial [bacterium (Candidatus Stahlbacteria)]|nr:VCBS repeat-containing protein [Candidatus Stahlbacteria bacterium]